MRVPGVREQRAEQDVVNSESPTARTRDRRICGQAPIYGRLRARHQVNKKTTAPKRQQQTRRPPRKEAVRTRSAVCSYQSITAGSKREATANFPAREVARAAQVAMWTHAISSTTATTTMRSEAVWKTVAADRESHCGRCNLNLLRENCRRSSSCLDPRGSLHQNLIEDQIPNRRGLCPLEMPGLSARLHSASCSYPSATNSFGRSSGSVARGIQKSGALPTCRP